MRIAVLVYGRLNKCSEHYDNILEHLGKQHQIDFFLSSDNPHPFLLNKFNKLYTPVSIITDPVVYSYDLAAYPRIVEGTNIHNMTCHFINKNRVFKLLEEYIRKNHVVYDVIVSLRIDCMFKSKFDFTKIEENTIYIPYGCDFFEKSINDQIAYGSFEVMQKYNSINPKELLDKQLSIVHPESLNYANIHFHQLHVTRVSLDYCIKR